MLPEAYFAKKKMTLLIVFLLNSDKMLPNFKWKPVLGKGSQINYIRQFLVV
jgi:hypothetical protein